jgi:quercetin dioxygenase-like cupin family protein
MGTIHRRRAAGEWRWDGVEEEAYPAAGVTKQVLIGPAEGARRFAVRYFELAPGSASTLDPHHHDHGVLVLRGEGVVRLGNEDRPIGVGDVVYVSPDEVHQFANTGSEPLGFLCVIPPKMPTEEVP